MQKRQLIIRKPAYRHGQLLLEDDFIDEQQFHAHSRYRHARHLHGFGAVSGLEVSRAGDLALTVSAGFAVDRKGREIELHDPETIELSGLPAGSVPWVTIGYRTERLQQEGGGDRRIDCYAVLRVATGVEPADVRLASVQLDERGRIAQVQHDERDVLRTPIAAGSVGADALDAQLRKDWIAMSFHPSYVPQDTKTARPPFRVGATQAQSHADYDGKPNTRGAAGTMALMLPPGIRHLHRFRIAGAANDSKMTVLLLKGGFDIKAMKHLRDEVLSIDIGAGPYCETVDIPEAHRSLADRNRTLAVEVQAEGFAKVSMVAVQVSY